MLSIVCTSAYLEDNKMHQGVVVDTWTKVSQKCIEDLCYLRLNFIQCEIVGSRIVQFKSYLDKLWQCSKEFQVIKKLNYIDC